MLVLNEQVGLRKFYDRLFVVFGVFSLLIGIVTLLALLIDLAIDGAPRLSWQFITSYPSRLPEKAGVLSAWVGSLLVMVLTAFIAIPLGIGAGVYLEEYAPKNWFTDIIEINIANLAGVPSIIYGIMALGFFVYKLHLGQSLITAALTLALLVLPTIIIATREALRTVPLSIREAACALGSTRWQTVRHFVLPSSFGGILTGIIIALSRAIGETAPLLTIGALTFIAFLPDAPLTSSFPFLNFSWIFSPFTVLPIQMFNWTSRPQAEFHANAAAAGLILMFITLLMNAIAIYLRYSFRKRVKW